MPNSLFEACQVFSLSKISWQWFPAANCVKKVLPFISFQCTALVLGLREQKFPIWFPYFTGRFAHPRHTQGIAVLPRLLRIVGRKICSRLRTENDRRISNKCESKANNVGAAIPIRFSLCRICLMPLFLTKLPTPACAAVRGLGWEAEDHAAVKSEWPHAWHIVPSVSWSPLQASP